jgi:hypothetical protein
MTEETYSQSDAGACSVLFIGGLADGQWCNDPGQRYWKMCGDSPVTRYDAKAQDPVKWKRNEAVYRRETIQSGREHVVFYVLDSLETVQAIRKLVRGYSPQN